MILSAAPGISPAEPPAGAVVSGDHQDNKPQGQSHLAHDLTTQGTSILPLIFNTAHFPCAVFAVPILHKPFSQINVLLQLTGKALLWGRYLIIF